jgi:hypothetical protein
VKLAVPFVHIAGRNNRLLASAILVVTRFHKLHLCGLIAF